jgi:7,8-dihydroneopterin aldolase/epimerase/oxygenase
LTLADKKQFMRHSINVEGIKLYSYHGCLEEEARIGGNYIVDVYMTLDFTEAAETDNLQATVDYCRVYEIAKAEMAIRSKLLEHVCLRIHQRMRAEFPQLATLHVRVTKLVPPMNGDVERTSVEIKD